MDYNFELSRHRAEAVRHYFISHGLTNQFTAVGYGASRPLSVRRRGPVSSITAASNCA